MYPDYPWPEDDIYGLDPYDPYSMKGPPPEDIVNPPSDKPNWFPEEGTTLVAYGSTFPPEQARMLKYWKWMWDEHLSEDDRDNGSVYHLFSWSTTNDWAADIKESVKAMLVGNRKERQNESDYRPD